MRSLTLRLKPPAKGEYVTIFAVCCLHIGHKGHDRLKAMDYRNYILRTPDTYAFDLGDDIENAVPGDEVHNSMMWDSDMTPADQYRAACDFWLPLVEKGKLLVTHDSNHWWRTEAKTGISMAEQMNIFLASNAEGYRNAPRWGRWQALSRVLIGRQSYTVHSQHGAGGGTTPAAALKKCMDTAMSHHADVYLRGHHHKKIVHQDAYFDWPPGAKEPAERTRSYGVTGCFIKWDESYAERAGLAPSVRGAIKVDLSARRHDVRISL